MVRIDLIMHGMDDSTINVYLQYENETFAPPLITPINVYSQLIVSIYCVDVNSDTIPDVLLLPWNSSNISVFLGYGNGTFHHSPISTSTPSFSSVLHDIGDTNEDGQVDLILAFDGEGLSSFFGLGNGRFVNGKNDTFSIRSNLAALAVRDINDDQHLDLIVIDDSTSSIVVRLGDGHGRFQDEKRFPIESTTYNKDLSVGDFNGDSVMDVAVIYLIVGTTEIYLGRGDGTWTSANMQRIASEMRAWAVDDFNEDDRLDWITSSFWGLTSIKINVGIWH